MYPRNEAEWSRLSRLAKDRLDISLWKKGGKCALCDEPAVFAMRAETWEKFEIVCIDCSGVNMKGSTRARLDLIATVVGAGVAPLGVWAQAGAKTDVASVAVLLVAAVGAGCIALRAWIRQSTDKTNPPANH